MRRSALGVLVQPAADDVPYSADGVAHFGRQRFDWPAGSTHLFSVAPTTPITPGTRRDFVAWGDGGAADHELTVPPTARGLRLDLQTMHSVQTTVDSGGSATESPGWIPEGQDVTLSAHERLGYTFVKWGHPDSSGRQPNDVLTSEWTHPVLGPESWEACFVRRGLALTISASDIDPWVNLAPPAHGPHSLYLWAACLDRGIAALEADVTGSFAPMSFTPADGVLNLGDGPNLFCAIGGCPIGADAPRLLGSWTVMDEGGDLCLAPSAANGLLVLVRCPSEIGEAFDDFRVIGFSSLGDPCDLRRAGYSRVLALPSVAGFEDDRPAAPKELRLAARAARREARSTSSSESLAPDV